MLEINQVQFCPQCLKEQRILKTTQLNLKYLYLDCGHIVVFDETGYIGVQPNENYIPKGPEFPREQRLG